MKRYRATTCAVISFAFLFLSACGFNDVTSTEPTSPAATENTAAMQESTDATNTSSLSPISSLSSTPSPAATNPPTATPTGLYTPTFTSTPTPTTSSSELTRVAELALTPSATPIPSPTPVTPSQPGYLTTVGQLGGYTGAVAVQDQLAFLGVGPRLVVLDISNPAQPQAVGQSGILPHVVQAVSIQDDDAYIVTQDNSLHIFSISDVGNLQEIGSYQSENSRNHRSFYWDLELVDHSAYLLQGGHTSLLSIIDISNPTQPVEVAVHELPRDSEDIVVSGNYLYVTSSREGLFIFDMTNPAALVDVARQSGEFSSIAIQGTAVYLAAGDAGMHIFDISNPARPLSMGLYQAESMPVSKVIVEGNLAYVSDSYATQGTNYVFYQYGPPSLSGTVRVLDITNPARPVEISTFTTPLEIWGMAVENSMAFLATGSLRIFDLSTATKPIEVGNYEIPGEAWDVTVRNNLAYVAGGVEGVYAIDVTTPSVPAFVSTSQTFSGHALYIAYVDNRLYVTNNYGAAFFNDPDESFVGIRVFDTSDPAHPIENSAYRLSEDPFSLRDLTAVATTLYTIRSGNFLVIDMGDPANPVEISAGDLGDYVYSMAIDGNHAFLTSGSELLHVLDISDPENPFEVSSGFDGLETLLAQYNPQLSITLNQIVVMNGFAFVECIAILGDGKSSDLCVIDVHDPATPKYVSLYKINSDFRDLVTANGHIFVTTRNSLLVLNPANPTALELVDSIPLSNPHGIEVIGSTIYVTNGAGGLVVLQTPTN